MGNLREAAQQALAILEFPTQYAPWTIDKVAVDLRTALAQPDDPLKRLTEISEDLGLYDAPDDKAQPVAIVVGPGDYSYQMSVVQRVGTKLYTTPQQQAPTFEQFCKKYGLDLDQMDSGGGMWARVAIEDWQKASAQPPAEHGAELSDLDIWCLILQNLGVRVEGKLKEEMISTIRDIIAADRAARGGAV